MDRDIWSIVFEDDNEAWLVTQQLKSLILFENSFDYNLVINADNFKRTKQLLKHYKFFSLAKKSNFAVNIYTREDLVSNNHYAANGYIDQQLIKLSIYKKSQCKESIILDAKNIAIKKDPLRYFTAKPRQLPPNNFFGCWEACLDRWHNGKIKEVRPTTTPYLFNNNILLQLANDFINEDEYFLFLKSKFQSKKIYFKELDKLRNPNGNGFNCLSEFIIYDMFEQKISLDDKERLPIQEPTTSIHVRNNPNVYLLKEASFLSIHRNFIQQYGKESASTLIKKCIYDLE